MAIQDKLVDNTQQIAGNAENVLAAMQEDRQAHIPEKFRGKTLEDVAKSYLELEQQFGKQGQELGELRKLTDAYLLSEVNRREPKQEPTPVEDISTFDDSDPVVKEARKLVEKELSPFKQELAELKREKFVAKLSQKHADFETIVQDKSFQDWVMESPVRVELFKKADLAFDVDSATELFNIWKERTGRETDRQAKEETRVATNAAFDKARMETTSTDEPSPKKKYRRADLIELRQRQPDRYRALEAEIMQAYREGRIY